ncbi:MAG: Holliday junction branch migration DNA helicase RuvB, partial [Peptococcus niger]
MRDERIISPEILDSDEENISIRPKSFDEYIGQDRVKANMNVYVRAAKERGDALD